MSFLSEKRKIIFIAPILLVFILFIFIFCNLHSHSKLRITIINEGEEKTSRLLALNKSGRKNITGSEDLDKIAAFKFTKKQKKYLTNYMADETASLSIDLKLSGERKQSENMTFYFGFIGENSLDKKNYLSLNNPAENNIKCDLLKAPDTFRLMLSFDNKSSIPEGFYIYSPVPCKIEKASIVPAKIGFDISEDIPVYCFSFSGGSFDFSNKSFDFSCVPFVFPEKYLYEFVIKLSDNNNSTFDRPVYSNLYFGDEKVRVKNVKAADKLIVPAAGLKNPYSKMIIKSCPDAIKAVFISPSFKYKDKDNNILKPIKTDPGLILSYNQDLWRNEDFEFFQWDRNKRTIIFDTKDYKILGKFFARMAYFIEKRGFKGRLLTDKELGNKRGYNAHDYSTESMALFYNTAYDKGFALNKEELILKKILIENDYFSIDNDGQHVIPNEGGIASISRESYPWLRRRLFSHEVMHTIFFGDEDFRNFVTEVYYTMEPRAKDFIIDYFKSQTQLGYDTDDEYLMKNEFMAYMMQQSLSEVPDYFVGLANIYSVKKYSPELSDYVIETNAEGIEEGAARLNNYIFDKYGIIGGNICLVSK